MKIDVYRRGVQRAYLTDVAQQDQSAASRRGGRVVVAAVAAVDVVVRRRRRTPARSSAMLRGELKQLDAELARQRSARPTCRPKRHLDDARQQISHISSRRRQRAPAQPTTKV